MCGVEVSGGVGYVHVEVCVSVYGWRWLVDGWWYVEMEVRGVAGVFGVWKYVSRDRGMWKSV